METQETRVFPDNKVESWGWCGVRATGCLTKVAPPSVQIRTLPFFGDFRRPPQTQICLAMPLLHTNRAGGGEGKWPYL